MRFSKAISRKVKKGEEMSLLSWNGWLKTEKAERERDCETLAY